MASFKYIVTVQEPVRPLTAKVGGSWASGMCSPDPEVREFDGREGIGRPSELAIGHARAQHRRPDGTTITIHRRRLIKERWAKVETGRVVETGPWLVPYRRYLVSGGVVRRAEVA